MGGSSDVGFLAWGIWCGVRREGFSVRVVNTKIYAIWHMAYGIWHMPYA